MRPFICLFLIACAAGSTASEDPPEISSADAALTCRKLSAFSDTTTDDWRWTKRGAPSGLPASAAPGDGLISPALSVTVDGLHLWFSQKVGLKHSLFHALSTDRGATFKDVQAVEGLGDHYVTAYPSVWRENGRFHMIFGSGSFSVAASDDGVHFELVAPRVLTASFETTRFDALSILYPSRLKEQLFFSGFDGRRVRIGRALVQADGIYEVDPPAPVLDVGEAGSFDSTAVAQPQVRHVRDRFVMFYAGYDTTVSNPGPYRIGLAESLDGIAWRKRGVSLPLADVGVDAWSTRDPAIAAVDGRWLMIYVGLGDDNRYRLLRATTDLCGL